MNLKLSKPLAFIDLEATGTVIGQDRIVEISILKLMPDGTRQIKTRRINPEIPIPPEITKIHGMTNADLVNEPVFKAIAGELAAFIDNSDLAGYNSNKFDIPMLVDEFLRSGLPFEMKGRKMVDVQNIFHKMEQRTLAAAYKFYCDKAIENAHSAEADIFATYEVMMAQLEKYPSLKPDVDFLSEFSSYGNFVDFAGRIVYDDKQQEIFNFGKHKGKTVKEIFRIEPSYYDWMMKGDFSLQTKQVITSLRLRDFNAKV